MFFVNMEFQAKNGLFKRYDLRPVAEVLMRNPNPALAFTRNYHGEWSFLARLNRPVRQMDVEDKDMYLKYFPDSLVFVRTEHPEEVTPYDIIFSMPYKIKDTYYIIVKRGTSGNYSK
ncbi:MAG: hypothetical protein DI586_06565 [Micavibrio aeruginosavorus]|uniref:Uncharacterized protein n=1 Tax=Micavibrio aeruginosavorus TaxID=349221 RepID=A0A2W5FP08_9BACT|nr:MAG: hypothetical protein DI586_06565 [Micavibrio aeruginosavorus]